MFKLYDFAPSGNCYKIRLAMSYLQLDYQRIPIDIVQGETRTTEFLHMNPNGKVPLLETDDGHYLPESNAILWYLANGTDLLPTTAFEQAQVLQWLFFEQYSHEPNIATSRYWISILNAEQNYRAQLEEKKIKGYAALDVMELHLQSRPFFVADRYSIADIGLYAYTHVAEEGGFSLAQYPAIREWFKRVENTPYYLSITD